MTKNQNSKPVYDLEERTFQFAKDVRLFVKTLPNIGKIKMTEVRYLCFGHWKLRFEIFLKFGVFILGFNNFVHWVSGFEIFLKFGVCYL